MSENPKCSGRIGVACADRSWWRIEQGCLDLARVTHAWMGLLRILARSRGPRTQATGNPSRERTDNRRHTHRLGIRVALEHR
jgi:hypothetical protein